MKLKKDSSAEHGLGGCIKNILPSSAEILDEIGNAIARLVSGPDSKENRKELKKAFISLKEMLCDVAKPESLTDDIKLAFAKFEECLGAVEYRAERAVMWARLMAVSWACAFGAMLLDRRWKSLCEAIF